jgi:hypothetical protein
MPLFTDPTEDTFHTVQLIKLPADKKWCIGIDVSLHYLRPNTYPAISIYTGDNWCGTATMILNKSDDSYGNFRENYCSECEYYDSDADEDDDDYCPSYDDGLGSVSFPCIANYHGPETGSATYDSPRMRFTQLLPKYNFNGAISDHFQSRDLISATLASIWYEPSEDRILYAGDYRAANTFDSSVVCWDASNRIEPPTNLSDGITIYAASKANEDLITFDDFEDQMQYLNNECNWAEYDHGQNELLWLQVDDGPSGDLPVTPLPSAVACINRYANREVFYRLRAMGVDPSCLCKDWIFVVLDHFYCDDFTGYISRDIKRPCAFTLQGVFCGQIPEDSLPSPRPWAEPQSAFVSQKDITLDNLLPTSNLTHV